VGVLLAARLVAGASGASSVVPEGYEDYSLEGGNADQVQVKSRQVSRGHFTPNEVAGFVTKVCEALQRRRDDGAAGAPVLMLEVGVATTDPDWGSGSRIGELPAGHPLRSAVLARAQREGVPAGVCEETRIVVAPWGEVRAEAARLVIECYGVLPQEAEVVLRALRHEVVSCIDANAHAPAQQRASLDRTSLEGAVAEALGVLNTGGLEEALTAGVCEPVDLRSPLPDARFYEGVSTQPGHVAAGLVVSRPGIQEAVVAASEAGSPVLLAGPSGVGKSATLWMSLRDMPGVLWFRVRRLRDDDVPALIRLVRAYGASPEAPVGLAVDSVGLGATSGWDALQRELAAVPGSRLVGSVRTEDLAQLSAIADCVVVEVDLDEQGPGKVVFQQVRSSSTGRAALRA